jgi:hypothetical protein
MINVTERVHGFNNVYEDEYRVEVRMQIIRRSSYYALTFILPSAAITALSLFGNAPFMHIPTTFAGMFIPSMNSQERTEKCTMGLTALLTMAIVLLMVTDVMPKVEAARFPLLGGCARNNSFVATIIHRRHLHSVRNRIVHYWHTNIHMHYVFTLERILRSTSSRLAVHTCPAAEDH